MKEGSNWPPRQGKLPSKSPALLGLAYNKNVSNSFLIMKPWSMCSLYNVASWAFFQFWLWLWWRQFWIILFLASLRGQFISFIFIVSIAIVAVWKATMLIFITIVYITLPWYFVCMFIRVISKPICGVDYNGNERSISNLHHLQY